MINTLPIAATQEEEAIPEKPVLDAKYVKYVANMPGKYRHVNILFINSSFIVKTIRSTNTFGTKIILSIAQSVIRYTKIRIILKRISKII